MQFISWAKTNHPFYKRKTWPTIIVKTDNTSMTFANEIEGLHTLLVNTITKQINDMDDLHDMLGDTKPSSRITNHNGTRITKRSLNFIGDILHWTTGIP